MSFFKKYQYTGAVYHPVDVNSTKKTNYSTTADFSIKLHVQRMGMTDTVLLSDIYGNYYAHSNDTNAGLVKKGDRIKIDDNYYYISDFPRKFRLFGEYRYTMKE